MSARACGKCGKPVRRKLPPIAEMLAGLPRAGVLCAECAGPDLDPEAGAEAWTDLGKLIDEVGEEDVH